MHTFALPSGIEIGLVEMTGAEEDLLTNRRLMKNGEAINQVLLNCTKRLGDNVEPKMKDILDLLSGDRLYALVRLRQVSLGDEVELELACPNTGCGERTGLTVNLGEIEVTPYGEEREFEFTLPGSGRKVKFGYLDGHKEKRLAALKEPNLTAAMMIRIVEIDGQPPSKKALNEMTMGDRSALRKEMLRVDGGIDTQVDVPCDACGTRIRTRLEAEPAFLFPSVAS
ncbi:MAG TPA: hypothetical protein P5532_25795 [Planctomycetota bacterium]|nr:hypothetical protein [Planctomycetota bacterium]